ncbi:MAG: type II secretion system F family protein [Candidatus Omnitrophica bacterium]|nr:type II secretion system F family protein [Candidatus Omnitrophota bacterium]
MPKFLIISKDREGTQETGVVEAADLDKAVLSIQTQGRFVVTVQPFDAEDISRMQSSGMSTKRKFARTGVRMMDVVSFARQLATMLEAGVPLLRSISVIEEQVSSKKLSVALLSIKGDIEQGETFSKGLSKYPTIFGQFWVSLVEVGEASGTLPNILTKLTSYIEDAARFRAQVIGALIYPAILAFVCMGAVVFFALFVGPTFEKVFKDMGTELPMLTVVMLAIFKFLKQNFFLIILGMGAVAYALALYIKTPRGRWQYESFIFNLPVLGEIAREIVIERFASQLAVLVESGVPILFGLDITERLVENSICAQVIRDIREAAREGQLLADPMSLSGFFPPMTVQMVKVGEETGELAKMLGHVSRYYKQDVEEFMKRFSTVIEPIMLVVMGIIIGTIVISMFLPLFNLSG